MSTTTQPNQAVAFPITTIKQAIAGDMGGAIAAAVGGAGAMFTALKAQDASSEDKSK